jgi:hypothetical protein
MEIYTIQVTKRQLQLISEACDTAGRIYRGIPESASIFDNILISQEKQYSKDMHLKRDLLGDCLRMVRKIMNQKDRTDQTEEEAILYDLHQVIRHQFYLERKEKGFGVDSSICKTGMENLCIIVKKG